MIKIKYEKIATFLLLIAATSIVAQQKTVFFKEVFPTEHYALTDIVNLGNTFNVIIAEQGQCSSWNKKKLGNINIIAGKKLQSFNRLSLYTFNPQGELLKKSHILYTPGGDTLVFGNPPNNKHASKSLQEMSEDFPKLFKPKETTRYSYVKEQIGVKRIPFVFDKYNLSYFPEIGDYFETGHPDKEGKFRRFGGFLIDSANHLVTTIYGRRIKKVKHNEYKDFDFITYDKDGKLIGNFNLKFDYPKAMHAQKVVYSFENGEPDGKLFIMSYKSGIGKKYNDPEKNNFEIIYCNNNGELIFQKQSKLESEEKGKISFHGAYSDENNIYVHFNSFEGSDQFFGLIKIAKSGDIKVMKQPKTLLKSKMSIIKGAHDGYLNKPRTQLSTFSQEPGCNWRLSSWFKLLGAKKTSGNIYFWGQMVYSVSDPNYKAPTNPDGTPILVNAIPPKLHLHGEMILFSYKADDLSFTKAVLQNLPLEKDPYQIKLVDNLKDQLVFHVPLKAQKTPDGFKLSRAMYDKNNELHDDYKPNYLYNPMFINIKETEATNVLYKDILLLDLEKSIITRKDLVQPYVIGFGIDANNSHYLKVQKVEF